MKFTSTSLLVALAAAATVSAQTTYLNQTGPFALKVANSANDTLNGRVLYACHAGAAQEGICLGGSDPSPNYSSVFYYNTSTSNTTASVPDSGLLVWNLPIQMPDADHVSQAASITAFRLGTNVVVPYFFFETGTPMHFTDDGKLVILDWYDDSTLVDGQYPNWNQTYTVFNNWYVCYTLVGNYYYTALSWVTAGAPHDPTCQKVDVVKATL